MYKLKLGRSLSFLNENFYTWLDEAISLGFDSVDFDLCGKWTDRAEEIKGYKQLKDGLDAIARSGLYFNGVHISFGRNWDFSSPDEEKRAKALSNLAEIIPLIDSYNPYCYVIHGSYEPIEQENRQQHIDSLKRSLDEMLKLTKTTIAVEILPRTCLLNTSAEAIEIIDSMKSEQIKVCVDVNHFLKESSENGVIKLGPRIVTTHISDHDYINERHQMPGEGKIDWMALIGALEKIGYNGVFNYEVSAPLADIKANYDRLFETYNNKNT